MRNRCCLFMLLFAVAATAANSSLAQLAVAAPQFMSVDGEDIYFLDEAAGQPKIGVRRDESGASQIVVPMPGEDPVSQATVAWLGNPSNLAHVRFSVQRCRSIDFGRTFFRQNDLQPTASPGAQTRRSRSHRYDKGAINAAGHTPTVHERGTGDPLRFRPRGGVR